MLKDSPTRFSLALIVLLSCIGCTASVRSSESLETGWHAMQPIRARVLLIIPDGLDQVVAVHTAQNGTEFRLPLGRQAVDQIDRLLASAFTSTSIMMVGSEAEARDIISREDPELRPYDYVALPGILKVTSWDKGFEHGFEVDVLLELFSFDRARVEKIRGHGESRAHARSGSSPEQSARTALSYAVDAVKDGLEARRGALSR